MLRAILFITMSAALLPASLFAASITRGPYLQTGRPDGVTIRWRTDTPTDSRVSYGLSTGELLEEAIDVNLTADHEIALVGLASNTQYYYSVGSSTEALASGSEYKFRTSPPHGSISPTRIWILGDSGEPSAAAIDVRDAYFAYPGAEDTDVWLMLGDNAYDSGTDSEYQSVVFNRYEDFLRRTVLWSTRGNHDHIHSGANGGYYDIFTMPSGAQAGGLSSGSEAYYSFDYANIHFVCLDSEGTDRSASSAMLQWLTLDLAATTQSWIIAYWHHPPYSKGSHDSDDTGDSDGRMRDMRENALPILEENGVDLVLSGHSHSYERSFLIDGHYGRSNTLDPSMVVDDGDGNPLGSGPYRKPNVVGASHEGAVYTVAGCSSKISGGALDHPIMVTSMNVLGSLVLDVSGYILDAVFLDRSGAIRDRFRITKNPIVFGPDVSRTDVVLSPPSPNPFSSRTTIHFHLPARAHVRVNLFDVAGRHVVELLDEVRETGEHRLEWDGRDDSGNAAPPGAYFVQLESNGARRTTRIVRLDASRS
jgi:hypothetical protein